MDLSTLNVARLRKLQTYTLPGTYRLQDGSGNGCAGDPPGYPTYFTRSVYTQYGNNPPYKQAQTVIRFEGVNYIVQGKGVDFEAYKALMAKLYKPLPIDHPRVRMWIMSTYQHHKNCYNGHGDDMVIFPVPAYKLKSFKDDVRWNAKYRRALKAEILAHNKMVTAAHKLKATPDNHNAVRIIRRVYPDYQPELALIENPPAEHVPDWWESEAENPGPGRCTETQRHGRSHNWEHPINGKWCQWCGWKEEESAVA